MYGCPHPGVPYLRHMRSCRWLAGPVLCISLTIAAQSDTTARVALSQALDALKEARRDGQRDTINAAIKHHLRSVLEQDDAFTTDPDVLWQGVLARQPGQLAWVALLPDDPSVN